MSAADFGMYTRCSHCGAACEVSPEALAQGRGQLQCVHCGQNFDALEHLTRTAPTDPSLAPEASNQGQLDLTPARQSEAAPARTDVLVDVLTAHADFIEPLEAHVPSELVAAATTADPAKVFPTDTGIATPNDAATEAFDAPSPDAPDAAATLAAQHAQDHERPWPAAPVDSGDNTLAMEDPHGSDATPIDAAPPLPDASPYDVAEPFHPVLSAPAPSFIPDTAPTPPIDAPTQRRWPRWLAVAALLLLLAGQSIHAERAYLAADARWRPWLEHACNRFGCTLPAWHDPAAMRLMTRDVRPHPSVPGALLISASFRNDAPWTQQWPHLHLSLSDLNGQTIAQRVFAPDQYLGMATRDLTIQPGQTASVALEVRDPGKQAVAFEFDFR